MFFEQFEKLCVLKGVSPSKAAKENGISKTSVTRWKNGANPNSEIIKKFADYFGVTTDYLLGNEQKNKLPAEARSYSKETMDLADQIERLTPANRAKLSELVRLFLADQDKKK